MSSFDIVFHFILALSVVFISALVSWLLVKNKTNRLPEFKYKVNLPKSNRSDIEIAILLMDKWNETHENKVHTIKELQKAIQDERQKNITNN